MDQTGKLQALLDRGGDVFIPKGIYEITDTLHVYANTHVRCEAGTVLRLADGANCPIIRNVLRENEEFSEYITLEGGIWDGNNVGQDRVSYKTRNKNPDSQWGQLIVFTKTKDLTIKDLTVKDPNSFGIMLTDTERFTVSDIRFDCNCRTYNQDGVHINGWAKDGLVRNLKGNTNDDFVALNSDEGAFTGPDNDIENVTIDGVWGGEDGWTAVRLLSRTAHVRHITIRNIYGAYKFNAVSFTHWAMDPGNYGFFDDILLENIHASSCRTEGTGHGGLIWIQNDIANVGTVVIRDYFRTEPDDHHNTTSLIEIGDRVRIGSLILSGIHEKIPDKKPTITQGEDVEIGYLSVDGVRIPQTSLPLKNYTYAYIKQKEHPEDPDGTDV